MQIPVPVSSAASFLEACLAAIKTLASISSSFESGGTLAVTSPTLAKLAAGLPPSALT